MRDSLLENLIKREAGLALETLPQVELPADLRATAGIYGFDGHDARSRPFNMLRTSLLKVAAENGWSKIGIVSATPGEGKTFVSINLAAALSRTPDVRAHLLDLDLRRSAVGPRLGLGSEQGLGDFLAGRVMGLEELALRVAGEELVLFPTRPVKESSAELVAGPRMDELQAWMQRQPLGSIFICDLPPALVNDDAAIITSKLDAYLLVVEEGRTTRRQIEESMKLLSPAICGGTILNRYFAGLLGDDLGYGYGNRKLYGQYFSEGA